MLVSILGAKNVLEIGALGAIVEFVCPEDSDGKLTSLELEDRFIAIYLKLVLVIKYYILPGWLCIALKN